MGVVSSWSSLTQALEVVSGGGVFLELTDPGSGGG